MIPPLLLLVVVVVLPSMISRGGYVPAAAPRGLAADSDSTHNYCKV